MDLVETSPKRRVANLESPQVFQAPSCSRISLAYTYLDLKKQISLMSVVRCVADASLSYLLPPLSAPPFTIQRLSELILQPTLYHTPTKYLSAIRRVLSVTAERDSFPILDKSSTIDETAPLDLNVNVNGILNSAINGDGSSPAFHPNSLFQSTSGGIGTSSGTVRPNGNSIGGSSPRTPYARNNEPIFSPIPFLIKDHLETSSSQNGDVNEIPKMELGESETGMNSSGDSAGEVQELLKQGKEDGSEKEVEKDVEMKDGEASSNVETQDSKSNVKAEIETSNSTVTPNPTSQVVPSTSTADLPNVPTSIPLGVPLGRVDELDDLPSSSTVASTSSTTVAQATSNGDSETSSSDPTSKPISPTNRGRLSSDSEMRPISSTTTVSATGTNENGNQVQHGDDERQIKRIRSDRNLRRRSGEKEKEKEKGKEEEKSSDEISKTETSSQKADDKGKDIKVDDQKEVEASN